MRGFMGVVDFVGGGKASNPPAAIFTLAECGRPADSFRPRAVDRPPKNGGVLRKRPRVSHESRGLLKNSPPLFSQHGRSALPSPFIAAENEAVSLPRFHVSTAHRAVVRSRRPPVCKNATLANTSATRTRRRPPFGIKKRPPPFRPRREPAGGLGRAFEG